jgi:hypothetical protein
MGINRRLRRLEGGHPLGDWCPDCGIWLGPPEVAEVEIIWDTGWEETENGLKETSVPVEEPIICPTCLEPGHIVIMWGDIDEKEEKRHKHIRDQLRQSR